MKARTKKFSAEAVRFATLRIEDEGSSFCELVPEWLSAAFDEGMIEHLPDNARYFWNLRIHSATGTFDVYPGDWVILLESGDIVSCPDTLFKNVFETVPEKPVVPHVKDFMFNRIYETAKTRLGWSRSLAAYKVYDRDQDGKKSTYLGIVRFTRENFRYFFVAETPSGVLLDNQFRDRPHAAKALKEAQA